MKLKAGSKRQCGCFESVHCNSSTNSMSSDSLALGRPAFWANLWLLHLKDPVFSNVFKLFRFFTSFVSFSVICLSFSSFCYPSVDCGRVASMPGLGLLFLWKVGCEGFVVFLQNEQN
jgi:hypothetical protein